MNSIIDNASDKKIVHVTFICPQVKIIHYEVEEMMSRTIQRFLNNIS